MKKKIIGILLLGMMISLLTACEIGKDDTSSNETTAEEIQNQIDNLFEEIDTITEEHYDLWEKLYAQEDDSEDIIFEDDSIYSGYMTKLIEEHGDLLSEEEVKTLMNDVEKIREIEKELDELERQYAELKESDNLNQDNPAPEYFPDFKGNDLDGKSVDSTIFKNNKVTVVNFWFSACSPCVEELDKLNTLNEELKEKGGAVIGINTDTLDGSAKQIEEAKEILEQKGAVYQNIYFPRKSKAGEFAESIIGFPTTYVVDNNGKIIGEPLMGGIDYPEIKEALHAQIDQALNDGETSDNDLGNKTNP